MKIVFDQNAFTNPDVEAEVSKLFDEVPTLEQAYGQTVIVQQDGKGSSYYVRCSVSAAIAADLLDLDARLNPDSPESYRANRNLLLQHNTYRRMQADAIDGREFSDIIVEYNTTYNPDKPFKVWGGQHRSKAIEASSKTPTSTRYHGFRVYFRLSKEQRTELALVSNTNINVSNDLFDRLLEETIVGPDLRNWCVEVGMIKQGEDFPDIGSRAERITVQSARTFLVNFYIGKKRGQQLADHELDRNFYEPYLCLSGAFLDDQYNTIVNGTPSPWSDVSLKQAGQAFADLHKAQYESVRNSKSNKKAHRNKCLTDSVLSGWSYVAGLLQYHPDRLRLHLTIPQPPKGVPDPLNAEEMFIYKHDEDPPTYRGLGTRSQMKDRQRMAQVFLARSLDPSLRLDKKLLNQAVSTVRGLKSLQKGYVV